MSFDTKVQQSRKGTTLSTVLVQIDNMSVQEATYMGGSVPYDSFWMFPIAGAIEVQRGDLFTDLLNIDPKTNANAKYRVFGNPERFYQDHNEIAVEKVVGT